jgi:molecular chaperone DnaJ
MASDHDLSKCYKELGLSPGSSLAQVKFAYHRLAKELHPDLHPGALGVMMSRVNKAYRILKAHLEKKEAYQAYVFQSFAGPAAESGLENRPQNTGPLAKGSEFESKNHLGPLAEGETAGEEALSPGPLASLKKESNKNSWRLVGLSLKNGALLYRIEVTGKPGRLCLPVRKTRACSICRGRGLQGDEQNELCLHCGGRGRITCSETISVTLPEKWRSGQTIRTSVRHQGMPIEVKLVAPFKSGRES